MKPGFRFTTPMLWDALNRPPTSHPLFWRTVRRTPAQLRSGEKAATNLMDKLSIIYLVLFVGAMLLTNMLDLAMQSAALAFLLLLLTLPILLPIALVLRVTLLSGSFFGTLWAMRISHLIAVEHTNNTFDLLALLPSGDLAGAWAICTGCLYRQHTFTLVLDLRMVMLRVVLLAGAVLMLSELLGSSTDKLLNLVLLGLQILIVLILLHVDYIHSTILAALVGMIVPLYTRADVRLWAAGGFLLFQVATYTLTLLTALILLPALLPTNFNFWVGRLLTLLMSSLTFFATREILITMLWQTLVRASNTDDVNCVFAFSR